MTKTSTRKVRVNIHKRYLRFRRFRPCSWKISAQKQNLRLGESGRAPHNTNQFLLQNQNEEGLLNQPTFGSMLGSFNPNEGIFRSRVLNSTSTVIIKSEQSEWPEFDSSVSQKGIVSKLSLNEERNRELSSSPSTTDEDNFSFLSEECEFNC